MARLGARARGYTSSWEAARAKWLETHLTCAMCGGRATVVHHRIPHRMSQARTQEETAEARRIFWNKRDWVPVCAPCHDGPIQQQERHGYHSDVDDSGTPLDRNHPFNR